MSSSEKTSMAKLRKRLKLTQAEFADRIRQVPLKNIGGVVGDVFGGVVGDVRSITDTRISRWERGENQPDRIIQAAVDLLADR